MHLVAHSGIKFKVAGKLCDIGKVPANIKNAVSHFSIFLRYKSIMLPKC